MGTQPLGSNFLRDSKFSKYSQWMMILVCGLTPFVIFSRYEDQYLSAKWIGFFLAALLGAINFFSIARIELIVLVVLAVALSLPDLRNGTSPFTTLSLLLSGFSIYLTFKSLKPFTTFIHFYPWLVLAASTLGHPNYYGEFLALFIVLQFHDAFSRVKYRPLYFLNSILMCAFMLHFHSRTAFISCIFGVSLVLLLRKKRPFDLRSTTLFLAAVVLTLGMFLNITPGNLQNAKRANIEIRAARWNNTLRMIAEKPLGWGLNGFDYGYLSFYRLQLDEEINESVIASSTHNILLDIAVKYGVHSLVLIIFFVFFFFKQVMKKRTQWTDFGLIGVFTIICISMFSVPFDTGHMNLFFFALLGICASEMPVEKNSKLFAVAPIITIGTYLGMFVFANDAYSRYNQNYKDFSLACRLLPEFKENCLKKGFFEFETLNDTATARTTLNAILEHEPNYFEARRKLIDIELSAKNQTAACEHLRWFERVMLRPTTRALFENNCK